MSNHDLGGRAVPTPLPASSPAVRPSTVSAVKKTLIAILKYGISLAILSYLFYQAAQDESFSELQSQPKQWGMLAAAFVLAISGVCLTMVRWYLLVRALEIPFSLRDAFRLGFIGYLFNFLTLGIVGGDAIKAVFIAREQHGRRAEAVSTVIADRIIGLYALFVLGSIAFLFVDLNAVDVRDTRQLEFIKFVCRLTFTMTVAGAAALIILLLPGFTTGSLWDALIKLPRIGPVVGQLIAAVRMYRRRVGLLLITILMSLGTHSLFAIAVFLVAQGLPGKEPSLGTHFIIVPIASVAGALPLPGGIGPFEYTLDVLYRGVSSIEVAPRQGFVIALAFGLIRLLIAAVGVVVYLSSRREVDSLLKEAASDAERSAEESSQADSAA